MIEDHLAWCRRRELRPTYVDEIRRTLTRLERQIQTPLENATDEQLETWWDSLAVSAGYAAWNSEAAAEVVNRLKLTIPL